ncbi:hypothetical protein KP509_21G069500 [Ceratopteris richardii]|uniref:Uncharacterized protein n=1 Tax=Ceratopteris richardii TaxID=49495 RepID=A0A8T2SDZ6_CERRI|nr:hypothetical protein KP509_21G069500 [Ceratopteris richardii]
MDYKKSLHRYDYEITIGHNRISKKTRLDKTRTRHKTRTGIGTWKVLTWRSRFLELARLASTRLSMNVANPSLYRLPRMFHQWRLQTDDVINDVTNLKHDLCISQSSKKTIHLRVLACSKCNGSIVFSKF